MTESFIKREFSDKLQYVAVYAETVASQIDMLSRMVNLWETGRYQNEDMGDVERAYAIQTMFEDCVGSVRGLDVLLYNMQSVIDEMCEKMEKEAYEAVEGYDKDHSYVFKC